MNRPYIIEIIFLAAAFIAITGVPTLMLSWSPDGQGRTFTVSGYNLADPEPGIWIISEGRPFKRDSQNIIKAREGELVTLRLTSLDVVHGFNLSYYNISKAIQPGKITEVRFVADRAGEFEFYCSARSCGPGHLEMKGKLIVEAR